MGSQNIASDELLLECALQPRRADPQRGDVGYGTRGIRHGRTPAAMLGRLVKDRRVWTAIHQTQTLTTQLAHVPWTGILRWTENLRHHPAFSFTQGHMPGGAVTVLLCGLPRLCALLSSPEFWARCGACIPPHGCICFDLLLGTGGRGQPMFLQAVQLPVYTAAPPRAPTTVGPQVSAPCMTCSQDSAESSDSLSKTPNQASTQKFSCVCFLGHLHPHSGDTTLAHKARFVFNTHISNETIECLWIHS